MALFSNVYYYNKFTEVLTMLCKRILKMFYSSNNNSNSKTINKTINKKINSLNSNEIQKLYANFLKCSARLYTYLKF